VDEEHPEAGLLAHAAQRSVAAMMSGLRLRHVTPALAVIAASTALAGCGILHQHSPIEEAVRFLPRDTTALVFTDREATAKRLKVDDVSGRDAAAGDVRRYERAFADQGWGTTQLSPYLSSMREGPFNELDVRWEVSARWGSGADARTATVWRADDSLDLSALGHSLTDHGYHEDTVDGLARYTVDFRHQAGADGLVGGLYPSAMTDVLIDSDEHLVVGSQSGAALADVARTAGSSDDSLADHLGSYESLVDKAGSAEFAAMSAGSGICQEVTPYGSSKPATPSPEYAALGHPVARALVATGDPLATINYLEFSSDNAASDDATARTRLIRSGDELREGVPFSQLGTFTVSHSGSLVEVSSQWATGPRAAVSAELTGGGPAACLPTG